MAAPLLDGSSLATSGPQVAADVTSYPEEGEVPHLDSSERRRHQRAGPFEGAWSGASGGSVVRISDLSEGGCFVESLSVPSLSEKIQVALALDLDEICVTGHVTMADAGIGFGVQFTDLSAEQRDAIRGAVQQLLGGTDDLSVAISRCGQADVSPAPEATGDLAFGL